MSRHANPIVDGKKWCTHCSQMLPIADFDPYRRSPVGLRSKCRACTWKVEKTRRELRAAGIKEDRRRRILVGLDGMKLCSSCGERKPADQFSPSTITAARLETRCHSCCSARMAAKKTARLDLALKYLCSRSKRNGQTNRSQRRNAMEFSITQTDLMELWNEQKGICPISGKQLTHIYGQKRVPTNASIDRIDNDKGYTRDNIRLVCLQVNHMRNELTDAELLEWCEAIISHASK